MNEEEVKLEAEDVILELRQQISELHYTVIQQNILIRKLREGGGKVGGPS